MVEVPDKLIAQHVIELAKEHGEYAKIHDTAHEGRFGQHEYETEWDLSDMLNNDLDVSMDDTRIIVESVIEGQYTVKVRSKTRYPNSKAHPAEYENKEIDLLACISLELSELSVPQIQVLNY